MQEDRVLASPNQMVWQYFDLLHRQVQRSLCSEESVQRQETAIAVFLAVAVLETFVNIYFRVVVSETEFAAHEQFVLKDLRAGKPFARKIEDWPKTIFGGNLSTEAASALDDLRKLRNNLTHFTSSHETVQLPGPVIINGMVDISVYNELNDAKAIWARDTVLLVAAEIFVLRGVTEQQVPYLLHGWFGIVPPNTP